MILRIKASRILVGLVAVAAMSVGGGVAQAGSVGLKATQNPLPGDPPWLYTIGITLTSGSFAYGSTIEVDGLVGVNNSSGYTTPYGNGTGNPGETWSVQSVDTTNTGNPAPYNYQSNFIFVYTGIPTFTYNASDPAANFLGNITIQTNAGLDFPTTTPPIVSGTQLNTSVTIYTTPAYNGGTPGPTVQGNVVVLTVPEPSSLSLLLIGGGALVVFRRSVRRFRVLES